MRDMILSETRRVDDAIDDEAVKNTLKSGSVKFHHVSPAQVRFYLFLNFRILNLEQGETFS